MKYLGAITDSKDIATKEYVDAHAGGGPTTITVALPTNKWSNGTQTVTATGVTSTNTVMVAPAPASLKTYSDAGVYCSAQGSASLTFTCSTTPTAILAVYVAIWG